MRVFLLVTKIPADLTCIKVNCFTSSILQVGKYSNRNRQKCLSEIGLMSVHLSTYKFFLFITTHYTILSGRDFHFVIVILSYSVTGTPGRPSYLHDVPTHK